MSWNYPYCNQCLGHARASQQSSLLFPITLGITLVIALVLTGSLGWGIWILPILGGSISGYYQHQKDEQLKMQARNQMKPGCTYVGQAVRYIGWQDSVHTFDFQSLLYAREFMRLNRGKLVNLSVQARDLLEKGMPTTPTHQASPSHEVSSDRTPGPSIAERLNVLDTLKDLGNITPEEHAQRRAEILRDI